MPHALQDYLVAATQKAAADLADAFLRLPENKRDWSPGGKSRTALDQLAECAVLNGYTAELIGARAWQADTFARFREEKAEAAALDWEALRARLQANTRRVAAAIAAVPDEALAVEIVMPGRTMTLAEVMARSCWNMAYHEGQINYIASLLA